MMRLFVPQIVLVLSTVVAWPEQADATCTKTDLHCADSEEASPFSVYKRKELSFHVHDGLPVYEGGDPNARFFPVLMPNELQFDRVTEGQKFALNSIITSRPDYKGLLTMEFSRFDLHEEFIFGLFFGEDKTVSDDHPFTQSGIEPVLTDERLILNIYPGVTLHLRNDMENSPDFKTFINDDIVGLITKVNGNFSYSSDHEHIKIKLIKFYTAVTGRSQLRSGAAPPESPKRYPPRVVEGP